MQSLPLMQIEERTSKLMLIKEKNSKSFIGHLSRVTGEMGKHAEAPKKGAVDFV